MSYQLTRKGKLFLVLVGLVLTAGLGYAIYYLIDLQNQVGQEPSDAAGICCGAGECNDGWTYGRDTNYQGSSCEQRNQEACAGHDGWKSGGGSCTTPPTGTVGCEDNEGTLGNGCCENPDNRELFCKNDLLCCQGSCRNAGDPACGTPGANCSQCNATCSGTSCGVNCGSTDPGQCGQALKRFVCPGQRSDGCNELNDIPELGSSSSASVDPSNKSFWCKTVQLDAVWSGGSNASVVYIGDGGEYCVESDSSCNPDNLDWSCCGDGIVGEGEQCDDGNTNDNDSCRNNCTAPKCGDGVKDAGEQCDDGNTNNNDSCRNNCTVPSCGDGIKDGNEECDVNGPSTQCSEGACKADCTCPDAPPPSCGNGTLDPGEQCDGNMGSCEYGSCASDCSCPNANPTWILDKSGASLCTAGSNPPTATVTYTITLRNTGSTAGRMTRVVDTLDASVNPTWVVANSIAPTGTLSGNTITWTLSGDDQLFDPGESRTFVYQLLVPSSGFGQLVNTVVAYPLEGSNVQDVFTMTVACETPVTGILDSAAGKIGVAMTLIVLSVLYMSYDGFDMGAVQFLSNGKNRQMAKVGKYRDRFERSI